MVTGSRAGKRQYVGLEQLTIASMMSWRWFGCWTPFSQGWWPVMNQSASTIAAKRSTVIGEVSRPQVRA